MFVSIDGWARLSTPFCCSYLWVKQETYISYVIYSSINVTRVTICQVNFQNNKTKAIKHILKILKKTGSCDSDILCLPELWYSKIVTHFESEFIEIIDAAKEYNITIIPGAFFERKNKFDFNNNNNSI